MQKYTRLRCLILFTVFSVEYLRYHIMSYESALNLMLFYQELEEELHKAWQELSRLQSYSSGLANQLSAKEGEVAAKDGQLSQLR